MIPTVAVPNAFLRGNRWYVRVQVPAAMKADLGHFEHWVSLRMSDRTVALQRAADATLNKRHEIQTTTLLAGRPLTGHQDMPRKTGLARVWKSFLTNQTFTTR